MTVIRVLACDPGVTTGYAYAECEPKQWMRYFVFQRVDEVDDFWKFLIQCEPRYILIEDFEFRQGRQRTGINLFPKELIGVARLYSLVANHQCATVLQKAATGKSYYSDKVLRGLGLVNYGDATKLNHGLDASRHLLHWLSFGSGSQLSATKGKITEFAERVNEWPK